MKSTVAAIEIPETPRSRKAVISTPHRERNTGSDDTHKLSGIHAPKHEIFDVAARTNTDPKGFVRAVDVYTAAPWGLYMARPTPGRAQFHYLESWLLPRIGLRANIFHWNPGFERDQDFYLDIAEITTDAGKWHTVDHYLDLVVRTGADVEMVDVDEFLEAVRHGLMTPEDGERAMRYATRAVEGLAAHDYDLDRWLAMHDMSLTWKHTI